MYLANNFLEFLYDIQRKKITLKFRFTQICVNFLESFDCNWLYKILIAKAYKYKYNYMTIKNMFFIHNLVPHIFRFYDFYWNANL